MKKCMFLYILAICLLGLSAAQTDADEFDWPRWRGPNGDGISLETNWNPEAYHEI
jgi:hypothetical protein